MHKIKKAVFPVAGLGTRFLPATKATPKEMLPIVDKPLIQYAVEEAVAAGITELIFVTGHSKRAIEDHFDANEALESKLASEGKHDLLALLHAILPEGVSCQYIRQPKALGLGHAVLCAQPAVGNAPFAVLLPDDLIKSEDKGCLQQMTASYEQNQGSYVAVEAIPPENTRKYGVVALNGEQGSHRLSGIVEKPAPEEAPSNLGVVGRYLLMPEIFDYLASIPTGAGGEIQLTDAIAELLKKSPVYAAPFSGTRYDCGDKLGYLTATLDYALAHPELAEDFKALLSQRSAL